MAKKMINVRHLEMGAVITIDGVQLARVKDAGMRWNKERWRFEFFVTSDDESGNEQTVTIRDFLLTVE